MNKKIKRPKWATDLLVVLLCVLVFTLGGGASWLYLQNTYEDEKSALENQIEDLESQYTILKDQIDTKDWLAYKEAWLGANFMYPPDWVLTKGNQQISLSSTEYKNSITTENVYPIEQIIVTNYDNQDFNTFVNKNLAWYSGRFIKINGNKAYELTEPGGVDCFAVYIAGNKNIISITFGRVDKKNKLSDTEKAILNSIQVD